MIASSFIKAMFKSRWVFSITLQASAALMLQRFRGVASDHLEDRGQGVLPVPRIDTLGRVADKEVFLPLQAGRFLQFGDAHFFGSTRVHRRFVHHGGAPLHEFADTTGGADQRAEIGIVGDVDRSRHRHDDHVRFGQAGAVAGVFGMHGGRHLFVGQFARRVNAAQAGVDLGLGDVKADGAAQLAEFDHQRKPDIAEADDADCAHIHLP
jgi:hypothetical protein